MAADLRFSIVIPTRNRPEQLARCLDALTHLDYPRDAFEVVVVDDGSATPLDPLVARFQGRLPLAVRTQAQAGPGAARNAGAAMAGGRWLVFVDDDCEPRADYLRALDAHVERQPDALLGGLTVNACTGNLFACASQSLTEFLCAYFRREGRLAFFTSNNLAIPADAFRMLGGYDATWSFAAGEDRDLCDRWRYHGGRLVHAPDAVIVHAHDLSAGGFLRQHFRYGRGAYRFHRARARDGRGRHELEPFRFYSGLLRFPFRSEPPARASAISALLAVCQIANALGYFWERAHARDGR